MCLKLRSVFANSYLTSKSVTDYRHCAETQGCSLPGCISTTFVHIVYLTTNDSLGYCRLRRQPFGPYFMYIYHLISIDLQSSCSVNSLPLQSLQKVMIRSNFVESDSLQSGRCCRPGSALLILSWCWPSYDSLPCIYHPPVPVV